MSHRLEYPLTTDDVTKYLLWFFKHSPLHRWNRRGALLSVLFVCLVWSAVCIAAGLYVGVIVALAFALFVFVVNWLTLGAPGNWLRNRLYRMTLDRTAGVALNGLFTLELLAEGLASATALGWTIARYEAIGRIVETESHVFITTTTEGQTGFVPRNWIPRGNTDAYILPRDRLQPEDLDVFLTELKRRCDAARRMPAGRRESGGGGRN